MHYLILHSLIFSCIILHTSSKMNGHQSLEALLRQNTCFGCSSSRLLCMKCRSCGCMLAGKTICVVLLCQDWFIHGKYFAAKQQASISLVFLSALGWHRRVCQAKCYCCYLGHVSEVHCSEIPVLSPSQVSQDAQELGRSEKLQATVAPVQDVGHMLGQLGQLAQLQVQESFQPVKAGESHGQPTLVWNSLA